MKTFKQKGVRAFKEKRFKEAKLFFSLASSEIGEQKAALFISICQCAEKNFDFAMKVFKILEKSQIEDSEVEKILDIFESDFLLEAGKSLTLAEVQSMLIKDPLKFEDNLKNLIIGTKLAIRGKDELLTFIEFLYEHNMPNMADAYLEIMIEHFPWDCRIKSIVEDRKW